MPRVAPPDPLRLIAEVVVPRAVDAIDLNDVLAEINLDQLLKRVDLDVLLAHLDIDALLDRVDVDAIVRRVDVDSLLGRVDLDALMERVDIGGMIRRAQVDAVVSATAGGLGNRLLDLIRRELVGMDIIVTRRVDQLLRRHLKRKDAHSGAMLHGGLPRHVEGERGFTHRGARR